MNLPTVKLDHGIHVMHLFYSINRQRWAELPAGESAQALQRVEALAAKNNEASHPKLRSFAAVSAKADFAFILYAAELGAVAQMHRDLENCFPPGTLQKVYTFLSVTELSEYGTTDEDNRNHLINQEKLQPESEQFQQRLAEL